MKKLLITLSLIGLSGCNTLESRGQFIDNSQVSALENKNLTKNEVINMIGYPTLTPDYASDTWYYASMSFARKSFTMPKLVSDRVVKVTFIGEKINNVEVFDKSTDPSIKATQDYTSSKGTEMNSLQRFIKNFGRFNKSSSKKKHR